MVMMLDIYMLDVQLCTNTDYYSDKKDFCKNVFVCWSILLILLLNFFQNITSRLPIPFTLYIVVCVCALVCVCDSVRERERERERERVSVSVCVCVCVCVCVYSKGILLLHCSNIRRCYSMPSPLPTNIAMHSDKLLHRPSTCYLTQPTMPLLHTGQHPPMDVVPVHVGQLKSLQYMSLQWMSFLHMLCN